MHEISINNNNNTTSTTAVLVFAFNKNKFNYFTQIECKHLTHVIDENIYTSRSLINQFLKKYILKIEFYTRFIIAELF